MPPPTPVTTPRRTATGGAKFSATPFRVPTMVKSASANASATRSMLAGSSRARRTKNVTTTTPAAFNRKLGSRIHTTGRSPTSRSRTVPPPKAVTSARTSTPNKSTFLPRAARTPEMAETLTPKCSSQSCTAQLLPVENYFARLPAQHGCKAFFEFRVMKAMRDHRPDVEAALQHHRHFVPGFIHFAAIDAFERQH